MAANQRQFVFALSDEAKQVGSSLLLLLLLMAAFQMGETHLGSLL